MVNFSRIVALATFVTACTAAERAPVAASAAPVTCAGGAIRAPADSARYGRCTAIAGDLSIEGWQPSDLTFLQSIRQITGKLRIARNAELEDLDGLSGLREVRELEIVDNPELDSVSGLEGLRGCGALRVSGNPGLRSLRGLDGITSLERLSIEDNGIQVTAGLGGLRSVGELEIVNNRALVSLGGLNNLRVAGSVRVHGNPRICSQLGFFRSLVEVEKALDVSSSAGVTMKDVAELRARARCRAKAAVVLGRRARYRGPMSSEPSDAWSFEQRVLVFEHLCEQSDTRASHSRVSGRAKRSFTGVRCWHASC